MALPNGPIDIKHNPLIRTPFYQYWDMGKITPPPPESSFMITEILGDNMITEATGDQMITE